MSHQSTYSYVYVYQRGGSDTIFGSTPRPRRTGTARGQVGNGPRASLGTWQGRPRSRPGAVALYHFANARVTYLTCLCHLNRLIRWIRAASLSRTSSGGFAGSIDLGNLPQAPGPGRLDRGPVPGRTGRSRWEPTSLRSLSSRITVGGTVIGGSYNWSYTPLRQRGGRGPASGALVHYANHVLWISYIRYNTFWITVNWKNACFGPRGGPALRLDRKTSVRP